MDNAYQPVRGGSFAVTFAAEISDVRRSDVPRQERLGQLKLAGVRTVDDEVAAAGARAALPEPRWPPSRRRC